MAKLTPKMASEIADIPYKAYENNGRFIIPGKNSFSNHFSFSENDVIDGFTGGVAGLSNVPVLRKVIPGLMRTSVYWSNETGHFIERQSMLINEVLYDRKTYL